MTWDWSQPLTEPLPAPQTPEEWRVALADPMWRICSGVLYKIMVKGDDQDDSEIGQLEPFLPNVNQLRFLADLHHRNTILKARQLGFCVSGQTLILTADLNWVRADEIEAGTDIVAVDEFAPGGRGAARKMRTGTVMAVAAMQAEVFRITLDDGRTLECTDRHPWLSRKGGDVSEWRSLSGQGNAVKGRLSVGTKLRWITHTWEPGGIEDGKAPVPKLAFTRMDDLFRLIGQTRPSRMIGNRFWEGKDLPGKRTGEGWSTIVSIESAGIQTVYDLQTSEATYIANGFVSHNTTLGAVMGFDRAAWTPNQRCGIIADEKDKASAILRDKVFILYENLPDPLRLSMPLKKRSETELQFAHNNSSIRVAISMRGGTIHFLHISELGKIAAKYPAKAREVQTGSLPAVPKSGIVTIESTAEGAEGLFFDMTSRAEAQHIARQPLNRGDYRFHFFPWFLEPGYVADPRHVRISLKQHEYFDKIEAETGATLTMPQRAWYVNKLEADFSGDHQLMKQEMPSCVVGETRVSTPAGIVQIADIIPDGSEITHHYDQGEKPVFEVLTHRGYSLVCTDDHPILCPDGQFRKIKDGLSVGDSVQMAAPTLGAEVQVVACRPFPFAETSIRIDERFAEFLGLFMRDGSYSHDTLEISCDGQDTDVIAHVTALMTDLLGKASPRVIGNKSGGIGVRFASKRIRELMFALDAIQHRENGGVKRKVGVPAYIFRSPKPVVAAFLRGLFEADGHVHVRGASTRFFAKDLRFIRDVQILLLAFGIDSRVKQVTKVNASGYSYPGCEMFIGVEATRTFCREIGFLSARKRGRIAQSLDSTARGRKAFNFTDEIVSITPAGVQRVYDITTATAQFNAGGIVVHNCPAEAWSRSTAGTYLTAQLNAARAAGRIGKVPHIASLPVHTFWDIGAGDGTGIWLMQQVGLASHFIRYVEDWGKGYAHYVRILRETGFVFGGMYLPHDANAKRQLADKIGAPIEMLQELAPDWNWQIVPRVHDFQAGIDMLRQRFPEAWFDEEGCKEGLTHLSLYRKKFNTATKTFRDEPEKYDGHSEAADALRQWAQGFTPSHATGERKKPQRRRSGMTA